MLLYFLVIYIRIIKRVYCTTFFVFVMFIILYFTEFNSLIIYTNPVWIFYFLFLYFLSWFLENLSRYRSLVYFLSVMCLCVGKSDSVSICTNPFWLVLLKIIFLFFIFFFLVNFGGFWFVFFYFLKFFFDFLREQRKIFQDTGFSDSDH